MKNTVIPIEVKAVLPTKNQGCAVFVGNESKAFIIYVDATIGQAIAMFLQHVTKERPLTHDLIGHILNALDAKLERVVINDLRDGTFFARLILKVESETHHKVIEIDARPSDSIALAMQAGSPIYVNVEVWNEVEDMNELLQSLSGDSSEGEEGSEGKKT
ncbi:MAG: bifunctional nuclease family protein [Verrucomicrobiae bacterium]|nr:bifunctional nuclease family protein [Verrucomicrobiae bacterium]